MTRNHFLVFVMAAALGISACNSDELKNEAATPNNGSVAETNNGVTLTFTAGCGNGDASLSKTAISAENSKSLVFQSGDIRRTVLTR